MPIGTLWGIDIVLSLIGSFVALLLLVFYVRKIREVRSRFTLGLSAFSGILFAQNILSIFVFLNLAQKYAADVAIPLMGIGLLEISALIVLAWLVNQ